jgi:glycosyltransferase involved in cell wall biosynthesis
MRLLILLPLAPRLDAANGGSRVITQFLTEITTRHKVAILYFREANEPGADAFFRTRCEILAEVVRPASEKSLWPRLHRYFRLLLSLFFLRPLWVSDWSSQLFAKETRRLAIEFRPDVIQAEFHVMGQYFSVLSGLKARRVLVEHEPGVRAALYLQSLPRVLQMWSGWIERISWQRYQTDLYSHVDAIVAFTEADRTSISKTAGRTPVHLISPGIVIPSHPLNPGGSPPLSLLFFGNFYHPPNADAGRRLVESIFPCVEKLFPDARLFIVGENPPASLSRNKSKNIVITGRVQDVTPYLDQAALVVAPIYFGGGMRIKVLESLAAGKATVTTSRAAEGLDIQDGEQLVIAETDDEFIDRIVQLLQNPEERLALSRRARAWACEHLGWETSIERYEKLYEGLMI